MKTTKTRMTRGLLAKASGVNIETIRYYEKIAILPEPGRSSGGYRIYDHTHLKRLSFVKRSRELGFTLNDIRELLELVDGGDYTCGEVHDRAVIQLNTVTEKINDLEKMRRSLEDMASKCKGGSVPDCPIVDALYSDQVRELL